MFAARLGRAIALLLFAWQAVVVQAHLHVQPGVSAAVSASASTPSQRRDTPVDCPVCREIAHAGQYLSPGPVLFHAPLATASWRPAAALPALGIGGHTHSWRSRAPPSLQLS